MRQPFPPSRSSIQRTIRPTVQRGSASRVGFGGAIALLIGLLVLAVAAPNRPAVGA